MLFRSSLCLSRLNLVELVKSALYDRAAMLSLSFDIRHGGRLHYLTIFLCLQVLVLLHLAQDLSNRPVENLAILAQLLQVTSQGRPVFRHELIAQMLLQGLILVQFDGGNRS